LNFNPKVAGNQGRSQQIHQPQRTLTTITISQAHGDKSVGDLQSKSAEQQAPSLKPMPKTQLPNFNPNPAGN
jgi:hypothetical protein